MTLALHPTMAAGAATAPTRRTVWSAVLLLAAVLFAGGLIRTVFSPLQEAAKLDLRLTDFAVSLVQGLATGAPIALVSIPLAWVIDHGNRVRLLVALFAVCVVGAFWTAFATGLTSLFLARMLSAVGASCAVPVIISLVADLCAPDRRGRAIVVLGLGSYAGAAAAFVPAAGRAGEPSHRRSGKAGPLARNPSVAGSGGQRDAVSAVLSARARAP